MSKWRMANMANVKPSIYGSPRPSPSQASRFKREGSNTDDTMQASATPKIAAPAAELAQRLGVDLSQVVPQFGVMIFKDDVLRAAKEQGCVEQGTGGEVAQPQKKKRRVGERTARVQTWAVEEADEDLECDPLMLDDNTLKVERLKRKKEVCENVMVKVEWLNTKKKYKLEFCPVGGQIVSIKMLPESLLQKKYTVPESNRKQISGAWSMKEARAVKLRAEAGEDFMSMSKSLGRTVDSVDKKARALLTYAQNSTGGSTSVRTGGTSNWRSHVANAFLQLEGHKGHRTARP